MTKRMLIDASHPEETRVVVLDGNRLEEFDVETEHKKPLKGNIYLAKVVRVEPSLQAAFVEYGGNRHGFLAFGEIHPDYYQIPVADRQRLLDMQAAEAAEDDDDDGEEVSEAEADAMVARLEAIADADEAERAAAAQGPEANPSTFTASEEPEGANPRHVEPGDVHPEAPEGDNGPGRAQPMAMEQESRSATPEELIAIEAAAAEATVPHEDVPAPEEDEEGPPPETVGGRGSKDEGEGDDQRERRMPSRFMRHYKIQEVIRRRQIMLVQVVKEERGNKGAALTTYISLAGRFSVLMPNSPRGGGISRKITSAGDRKRLRDAVQEVGLPKGMSLIVRTAGASRPKPEIVRDGDYLLRLWDEIRTRTMESVAPALVYEEADLIKRSIRDVFSTGIEDIQIEGEDAYRQAREFMRMLMPQHERKIRIHRDQGASLFARHGVDQQLDAMMSPVVQLKSGGYIVINQTEALVSIDVNSGRATRDRHIEDTALRTNCEAAEEVARQLRLRDLAGLIVIDFIDMEASRNDAQVERRLKEALKHDRARIQVGRISHFGLLEMSRQRLRPSVTEHSFITCPHCQGLGIVRSPDSAALQVLRAIEDEGSKRKAAEICVHVAPELALHLLNRKRDRLAQIEQRYGMQVVFEPDSKLLPPALRIERTRAQLVAEAPTTPAALRMDYAPEPAYVPEPEAVEPAPRVAEAVAAEAEPAHDGEPPRRAEGETGEGSRRRRRRRRRGGRREDGSPMTPQDVASEDAQGGEPGDDQGDDQGEGAVDREDAVTATQAAPEAPAPVAAPRPERQPEGRRDDRGPRRDGRDGGRREDGIRRRGRRSEGFRDESRAPEAARPTPEAPARYVGPTPANPFAGGSLEDIFDAMAAAEEAALRPAQPAVSPQPAPVEPQVVEPQAAEPVAAPAPEPVTAAEPVAATPAAPEAMAEPAPEAPAKPRARRAAKPKAVAEAATAAEPPLAQPPVAEASAPEEAPAAKPKRAPRGRKAEAAPAASPAEATVAAAEEAAPAKPARRRAAPKRAEPAPPPPAAAETVSGEAPAPAPVAPAEPAEPASATSEPVAAAPVQPVLVESSPDAPKKRGWWKR
ncbi:Rne/Rng family ribonuclease [Roseomonas haemaphysalidis]|uniref:Ribonuclease E n=1 Tax=Roseomonas haemaphysalidis TaxID=2768162 RepID=A0ABS3KJE7_9PROT|nr:ribonuclease E/G [Roseomonas haemaphysalidis]MBO1077589.1 ribonuclease E/G [Roseomonas haemaphysalidis]